jgi:hypothetical protein
MQRIESTFGQLPQQAVSDGGYVSRETVLAMDEKKIELVAPVPDHGPTGEAQLIRRGVSEEFFPEKFAYDAEKNGCICPAGRELSFERTETKVGIDHHYYRASYTTCSVCEFKSECCPENKIKGRAMVRSQEHERILSFKKRMETDEAKKDYKRRGRLIEFANAWIKEKMKLRRFHVRTRIKAAMEMTWVALAYNIRQWIRLCWMPNGS